MKGAQNKKFSDTRCESNIKTVSDKFSEWIIG